MTKIRDVTILVTFHNEGILAHSTLNSIERCRAYAQRSGYSVDYVWVLDAASAETRKAVFSHPARVAVSDILEVDYGNSGASRNAGIRIAGGKSIAVLDGDDYYSENWIERALYSITSLGHNSIIHPEYVVSFGIQSAYSRQPDQAEIVFKPYSLLSSNFWASWTCARREVFLSHPYASQSLKNGFGHEDWHWNCETAAAGLKHRVAPGTVGFYRRKSTGVLSAAHGQNAIIPPTKLFSRRFARRVVE